MYIGITRTERPIKFIYWTVTEISITKCSEGLVICQRSHRRVPTGNLPGKWSWINKAVYRDIYVKDSSVSLFSIWYGLCFREIISITNHWLRSMTEHFVAYRLFMDYLLNIGYNPWLINWLPIDYLVDFIHWLSLMSSISYAWVMSCKVSPQCFLVTYR